MQNQRNRGEGGCHSEPPTVAAEPAAPVKPVAAEEAVHRIPAAPSCRGARAPGNRAERQQSLQSQHSRCGGAHDSALPDCSNSDHEPHTSLTSFPPGIAKPATQETVNMAENPTTPVSLAALPATAVTLVASRNREGTR